jgi:hypothetical protein
MGEALAENDTLEGLSLWKNAILSGGAQFLIDGLARNRALQWLGLGGNGLGAEGCRVLRRALSTTTRCSGLHSEATTLATRAPSTLRRPSRVRARNPLHYPLLRNLICTHQHTHTHTHFPHLQTTGATSSRLVWAATALGTRAQPTLPRPFGPTPASSPSGLAATTSVGRSFACVHACSRHSRAVY